MATLENLIEKIDRYKSCYRHPEMGPLEQSGTYDLKRDPQNKAKDLLGWPDTWPHNNEKGIYGIFSNGKLLYIGKASQQPIGHRLSNYFRYGPNREYIINPNHFWSSEPTHVISWAVPNETFFEASALEEYLISEFKDDLPDNTVGRKNA